MPGIVVQYCTLAGLIHPLFIPDVEVKLTPLSSSKFTAGRPTEQANVLGTFVKTSIVE